MAPSKARDCPCCGIRKSGKSFRGHANQCTDCSRDPNLAFAPDGCVTCGKPFAKADFFHEKTGRGWRSNCRACHSQAQRNYTADAENKPPKTCKICEVCKPATDFQGPRLTCRPCKAKQDKEKSAMVPKADPATLPKPDTCCECGKSMQDSDLTLRRDTHLSSYRPNCTACRASASNGSNHTQNHRKRQRESDNWENIKRQKNEVHEQWILNNPTKPAEYQAKYRANADCKMRQIIQSAKQRGIAVVDEDIPAMTESLQQPCFYCGFLPEADKPINGLDRVDSSLKEYSTANTVSCCAACNHIKAAYSQDYFLYQVRLIAVRHQHVEHISSSDSDEAYRQQCSRKYDSNDKTDQLSDQQRLDLWSSPCYLCGHGPALGIDREDSRESYTAANCKPCCSSCNYMKSSVELRLFLSKIRDIFHKTSMYVLAEINQTSTQPGRMMSPVQVHVGTELVAKFPSRSSAARFMGVSIPTISSSIGTVFRGGEWTDMNVVDYVYGKQLAAHIVKTFLEQASNISQAKKKPRKQRAGSTVVVRDENGEDHEFDSQSKAAAFLGCSQVAISKVPSPWLYKTFVVRH